MFLTYLAWLYLAHNTFSVQRCLTTLSCITSNKSLVIHIHHRYICIAGTSGKHGRNRYTIIPSADDFVGLLKKAIQLKQKLMVSHIIVTAPMTLAKCLPYFQIQTTAAVQPIGYQWHSVQLAIHSKSVMSILTLAAKLQEFFMKSVDILSASVCNY